MEKLNLSKQSLKKFGITMAVCFLLIALLIFLKQRNFSLPVFSIALAFLLAAFIIPGALKPVYIIWMRLAGILGWINTRILLLAVFYLVFTPFSIVLRLMRKDLLDMKISKDKLTYWINKEKKEFSQSGYDRLF
ncbi:MAG: SxtJ family membrane protein [Candidatus Omnitrophica bacterium]|nr:SxtJ family membrane protein [Candidatus Omnitrophota bacterium]